MDMEDILKGVEQYYESVECCLDCNNYSDRDNNDGRCKAYPYMNAKWFGRKHKCKKKKKGE